MNESASQDDETTFSAAEVGADGATSEVDGGNMSGNHLAFQPEVLLASAVSPAKPKWRIN